MATYLHAKLLTPEEIKIKKKSQLEWALVSRLGQIEKSEELLFGEREKIEDDLVKYWLRRLAVLEQQKLLAEERGDFAQADRIDEQITKRVVPKLEAALLGEEKKITEKLKARKKELAVIRDISKLSAEEKKAIKKRLIQLK